MNTLKTTPVWKINDMEFVLDLEDADMMEKYEKAFYKMQEEEKKLPKTGSASEIIRPYCEMYYHLFDHIFQEGTSESIFHGVYNARLCDEVYESFLNFVSEYTKNAIQRRSQMAERYSKNKKQRRALQKQ